ncbi:6-phosphogluconolactonase [uncultured Planktomarina sp.]|uniref:6-phosphogluconolactonase n=1 Tax=uncultured Planktomarina sp. TaxID=1538529 RepID=UPI0032604023
MQLTSYETASEMMQSLSAQIASELSAAIALRGRACLAVPGGSTPGPLFDLLSQAVLDWANVTVMLTDERWVPTDSPRSNTGLIKNRLLVNSASAARYIALYAPGLDHVGGARALSQQVAPNLPIDVVVLGMGADMHTASLFPGVPELSLAQDARADAVMPMVPVGSDLEPRVTLSAQALETARQTHVLIIGEDKKLALAQAQSLSPIDAPIAQFLPNATVHWSPV